MEVTIYQLPYSTLNNAGAADYFNFPNFDAFSASIPTYGAI
jgi:hypothetical protein